MKYQSLQGLSTQSQELELDPMVLGSIPMVNIFKIES